MAYLLIFCERPRQRFKLIGNQAQWPMRIYDIFKLDLRHRRGRHDGIGRAI